MSSLQAKSPSCAGRTAGSAVSRFRCGGALSKPCSMWEWLRDRAGSRQCSLSVPVAQGAQQAVQYVGVAAGQGAQLEVQYVGAGAQEAARRSRQGGLPSCSRSSWATSAGAAQDAMKVASEVGTHAESAAREDAPCVRWKGALCGITSGPSY